MARQFRTHSLTVIGPDTYNTLIGLLTARRELRAGPTHAHSDDRPEPFFEAGARHSANTIGFAP